MSKASREASPLQLDVRCPPGSLFWGSLVTLVPIKTLGPSWESRWGRTCLPTFPPGHLSLIENTLSFAVKVKICPTLLQNLG